MGQLRVADSAVIDAPADVVYGIYRDYEVGHAAILPEPWFKDIKVLEGGVGAGTKIWVKMSVMGQTRELTLDITEPEPGRVLEEFDPEQEITTRFIIDPINENQCKATIETVGDVNFLEKLVLPRLLKGIYSAEFAKLKTYVKTDGENHGK